MGWTDERVERCLKLWADGWSATQIARDLGGITRNAVLGKIHRKGKAERATASKPARIPRTPKAPPRPTAPAAPSPPRSLGVKLAGNGTVFVEPETPRPPREVVPALAEGPGSATSLTLGAYQCKWPIGDPQHDDFTFCGARTDDVYCTSVLDENGRSHRDRAYQPAKASADSLYRSVRRFA